MEGLETHLECFSEVEISSTRWGRGLQSTRALEAGQLVRPQKHSKGFKRS